MTNTLHTKVMELQNELDYCNCSDQRQRHLMTELESLLAYQEAHPDQDEVPTQFQLYCFENPDAIQCRIFDV